MGKKRGEVRQRAAWLFICILGIALLLSACSPWEEFGISSVQNTIYGKLIDQDGAAVVGEIVSAEWVDEGGIAHHIETRTLSLQEARSLGSESLEGHFIFSQGQITAPQNATITIRSQPRFSVLRFLSPDKTLDVGMLTVLRAVSSPSPGSGEEIIKMGFSKDQIEGKEEGNETSGSFLVQESVSVAIEDESGYPLDADVRVISENKSEIMIRGSHGGIVLGPKGNLSSQDGAKGQSQWASMHAQWRNGAGEIKDASLHVISTKEAYLLGDNEMEGMIFIAKPSGMQATSLLAVVEKRLEGQGEGLPQEILLEGSDQGDDDIRVMEGKGGVRSWKLMVPLFIVVVMVCFIFIVGGKRKEGRGWHFFGRQGKSLEQMTVGDIMTKEVITIKENDSILDALALMIDHHINAVVVTQEKTVKGIITEGDFLEKVYFTHENEELKVREIMSTRILTVMPTTALFGALRMMIEHDLRKLPVIRNENIVGIVTATDIIRNVVASFANHPLLLDQCGKETVEKRALKDVPFISDEDSLLIVAQKMKEAKMGFVMVAQKDDIAANHIKAHSAGIITTKDLLEEFHKNPEGMQSLRAVHVRHSPLWTIDASKTIAEALELMLEHHIRRLPLEAHGRIIGIISQKGLLEGVLESIDKAHSKEVPAPAHQQSGGI